MEVDLDEVERGVDGDLLDTGYAGGLEDGVFGRGTGEFGSYGEIWWIW